MRIALLVGISVVALAICLIPQSVAQSTQPTPLPSASTTPTTGSIRVTVLDQVRNPGTYDLPAGSVVRNAIQSAGGLTEFNTWNVSYILRRREGMEPEKVKFTRKSKSTDMEIPLKDGDHIYLAEIYD